MVARIKVGQHLKGNQQPYIASWFEEFQIFDPQGVRPVAGMMGDTPALSVLARTEGLHVLQYRSTPDRLKYLSREQFQKFIGYEGLTDLPQRHQARGLPEFGFEEDYVRCAKALVPVGSGVGEDRLVGMPLELLAERNPFTSSEKQLPIRLFWQGKPLADTQVRIFREETPEPENEEVVRTSSEGRAQIQLPAKGVLLLNAVHLVELDGSNGAVWKSYWASMTLRF